MSESVRRRPELVVFLSRVLEQMLGRWREGPDPPARLFAEARVFRRLYPGASADEWMLFAVRLAEGAYRDGYLRGIERELRDPDPGVDDELIERFQTGWDVPIDLDAAGFGEAPDGPFAGLPPAAVAALSDQMGLELGTHRVVLTDVVEEDQPIAEGWVETVR